MWRERPYLPARPMSCVEFPGSKGMECEILVAKVLMPEKGVFTVRVDSQLACSGVVKEGASGRFVVALDYGEDSLMHFLSILPIEFLIKGSVVQFTSYSLCTSKALLKSTFLTSSIISFF